MKTAHFALAFLGLFCLYAGIDLARAAAVGAGTGNSLERPCIPGAGAATEVACLAATSASQELTVGTAWEVTCDNEAWVRVGVGSATAATGDFKYRAEQTYYFQAGGPAGINWFACKNTTTNGSCWLRECR